MPNKSNSPKVKKWTIHSHDGTRHDFTHYIVLPWWKRVLVFLRRMIPAVILAVGVSKTSAVSFPSISASLATIDLYKVSGTTIAVGAGASNMGTQRIILASDSPMGISTGSVTAFQGGTWNLTTSPPSGATTVTPGTGTWNAGGSTITVVGVGGAAVGVSQSGAPWTFNVNGTTFTAANPGIVTMQSSTVAITNVNGSTITAVLTNSAVSLNSGTSNIGTINGSTIAVVGLGGAAVAISAASLPSHAVTNAGTFAVQIPSSGSTMTVVGVGGAAVATSLATLPALTAGSATIGNVNGSTISVVGLAGANVAVVLPAETTKVIGTVNMASGQTIGISVGTAEIGNVKNSGTFAVQIPASGSTMTVVGVGGAAVSVSQAGPPWTFNVNGTTFTTTNPGVVTLQASTVAVVGPNGAAVAVSAASIPSHDVTFSSGSQSYPFYMTPTVSSVAVYNIGVSTMAVNASSANITAINGFPFLMGSDGSYYIPFDSIPMKRFYEEQIILLREINARLFILVDAAGRGYMRGDVYDGRENK